MTKILEIENLRTSYGRIQAIRGISLHVDEGEIVTIIGNNGAGKTTTLESIMRLIPSQSDKLIYSGSEIGKIAPYDVVSRGISLVPEGRDIFPSLTVEENLRAGAYLYSMDEVSKKIMDRIFELFPILKERLWQPAGTLSGGEQQMLAIARALMSRPRLLLMDEPSLGIAPNLLRQIFAMIKEINKDGVTILLVEQNANLALKLANRAYVLENGVIAYSGSAQQVLSNDEVRKAYLGKIKD